MVASVSSEGPNSSDGLKQPPVSVIFVNETDILGEKEQIPVTNSDLGFFEFFKVFFFFFFLNVYIFGHTIRDLYVHHLVHILFIFLLNRIIKINS